MSSNIVAMKKIVQQLRLEASINRVKVTVPCFLGVLLFLCLLLVVCFCCVHTDGATQLIHYEFIPLRNL